MDEDIKTNISEVKHYAKANNKAAIIGNWTIVKEIDRKKRKGVASRHA